MTNEEAVRQLDGLNFKLYKLSYGDIELFNECPEYGYDFDSALSLAIEAIEKQIPKKPVKDDRYISHTCPVCNGFLYSAFDYDKKPNYCRNCSQRIDWSDEE